MSLPAIAASGPAPSPKAKTAEPMPSPQVRLDTLFERLAAAGTPLEAQSITTAIEHLWLRSGSDTADMLMSRALAAINARNSALATQMLDKVIELEPGWAEAWNKRATLRYNDQDDAGSMADISHVLALEPRHYGALAGMGLIFQRLGDDKHAVEVFRRVLQINPQASDIRKTVDRLGPEVDGREI